MQGQCRFGNSCFNLHVNQCPSQDICRFFLQGTCTFGENCFNLHANPSESVSSNAKTNANTDTSGPRVHRTGDLPKLLTSLSLNAPVYTPINKPTSYYEALTGQVPEPSVDVAKVSSELCPYFEKTGDCPNGSECALVHGDVCDVCTMACLHPYNAQQRESHRQECMSAVERDMEEAFAVQRSAEKQCGICMETVWAKESVADRCFGVLENCNHVFCLACIRKWRASKSYENKVVKACPECRVKSDYVTPSRFWFEDEKSKKKIIDDYKSKLK